MVKWLAGVGYVWLLPALTTTTTAECLGCFMMLQDGGLVWSQRKAPGGEPLGTVVWIAVVGDHTVISKHDNPLDKGTEEDPPSTRGGWSVTEEAIPVARTGLHFWALKVTLPPRTIPWPCLILTTSYYPPLCRTPA